MLYLPQSWNGKIDILNTSSAHLGLLRKKFQENLTCGFWENRVPIWGFLGPPDPWEPYLSICDSCIKAWMVTFEQAQYKLHFYYKILRFSIEYRNFMNSSILTESTIFSKFVNPLSTWVLKIKLWKLFYRDNFLCSIWWGSQNF